MYETKVRGRVLEESGNEIQRLQDWLWMKLDDGVWDGPMQDWCTSHKEKWYKHIKKWDVAIQAGGAGGMYARMLAEKFKAVYTFEPTPASFHCLVNNCQLDHIIKINTALGERPGVCTVQPGDPSNMGTNKIKESGIIPILTIDSFQWNHCDLIALDVEGYEPPILRGGLETIKKFKPTIVLEGGNRGEITELLVPLGYKVGDSSISDTVYVC